MELGRLAPARLALRADERLGRNSREVVSRNAIHPRENGAIGPEGAPGAPSCSRPKNAQDPVLYVRIYTHIAHEPAVAGLFVSGSGAIAPNPRMVAERAASFCAYGVSNHPPAAQPNGISITCAL